MCSAKPGARDVRGVLTSGVTTLLLEMSPLNRLIAISWCNVLVCSTKYSMVREYTYHAEKVVHLLRKRVVEFESIGRFHHI